MKLLRILVVIVVALAGVLAIAGLLLPARLQVARSVDIAAAPERVYGYVAGFGRYNDWSPWAGLDPDAQFTLSGPAEGPGARMAWSSKLPQVGSGSQEVVAADPPREVTVRLVFEGQGEARSTLRLGPAGPGTRVTWSLDMGLGMNPLRRWIGFFVDDSVGADYRRGLERLKQLVEAEVAAEAAAAAAEAAAQAEAEAGLEAPPAPTAP